MDGKEMEEEGLSLRNTRKDQIRVHFDFCVKK